MKRNMNHGGTWPAIRAVSEDGKLIVGNFRKPHVPKHEFDFGPDYAASIPVEARSIDFKAFVFGIVASGVLIASLGTIFAWLFDGHATEALVLFWAGCCGATLRSVLKG